MPRAGFGREPVHAHQRQPGAFHAPAEGPEQRSGRLRHARSAPAETGARSETRFQERLRKLRGADFAAALNEEMRDLVAAYSERKKRAGKLDFLDLLMLVRNLVRDNRDVRNYLQDRFARIFVDEFQDTDPLQAEILILLSAGDPAENDWLKVTPIPGKLFVVGDPKQSIYKFRRADVVL